MEVFRAAVEESVSTCQSRKPFTEVGKQGCGGKEWANGYGVDDDLCAVFLNGFGDGVGDLLGTGCPEKLGSLEAGLVFEPIVDPGFNEARAKDGRAYGAISVSGS